MVCCPKRVQVSSLPQRLCTTCSANGCRTARRLRATFTTLPNACARAQDAQLEVRAAFGARVRRTLSALLAGAVQRAAKYAALLPLAAADPRDAHRTAAHHALSEYVALRRRAAAAAAASPRTAAGSGGTVLHELPDYLLPFLLQARGPGTLHAGTLHTGTQMP